MPEPYELFTNVYVKDFGVEVDFYSWISTNYFSLKYKPLDKPNLNKLSLVFRSIEIGEMNHFSSICSIKGYTIN